MTVLAVDMADFQRPSVEDIDAARLAARQLSKVSPVGRMVSFTVEAKEQAPAEPISVPQNIFQSIIKLLIEVGNGNAVQIVPVQAELTTQQAADLLNVSRPHLIKMLERNEIEYRMVGTHRKILAKCLLDYRDKSALARREALHRMVTLDEDMGLYNDHGAEPGDR